jgi:hypothetical protein
MIETVIAGSVDSSFRRKQFQVNQSFKITLFDALYLTSHIAQDTSYLQVNRMFKVTTRPATTSIFPEESVPSTHRRHPAELEGMDIDIDTKNDLGEGPSSLVGVVTPGEVITSAREFMRSAYRLLGLR